MRACFDYGLPVAFEAAEDRIIVGLAHGAAGIDDDVGRGELVLVQPEGFTDQAFHQVAPDRVADRPCRNGEPEAGNAVRIQTCQDQEAGVGGAAGLAVHAVELTFGLEALPRSEAAGPWLRFRRRNEAPARKDRVKASDRQALAAFRTPACQDEASALRGHARTKPVSPLAVQVARLIRALHDW